MPTIMETIEPILATKQLPTNAPPTNPTSTPTSNPTVTPYPKPTKIYTKRISHGDYIGSKRNHAKHASRKRIQSLINTQLQRDQAILQQLRDDIVAIVPANPNS